MRSINELIDLSGRVALVTGGAGFIGKAFCETLAEAGAGIVVLDRDMASCEAVATNLHQRFGIKANAMQTDLGKRDEVEAVSGRIKNEFGQLDILVNCAAFVGTSGLEGWSTSFDKQSMDTWREAIEVNLNASITLIQSSLDLLNNSPKPSIINIGSIYGMGGADWQLYEGTDMGQPGAYAASKGGLIQMTRWLATAVGPNIRVNCISPGGIYRNQPTSFVQKYESRTPMHRMGTEEDMKGALLFLASDLSEYVTGQNIAVDGGWTAW
ncbi:SDR family oxidoreductase [Pseudodesulfovibrio sp.]|nr:SDR family oxidoreductase [Pseudodesulfovibrio sp.]